MAVVALDIGGTWTRIAADGEVVTRFATRPGYDEQLSELVDAVGPLRPDAVGVSFGGRVNADGDVRISLNLRSWSNRSVDTILAAYSKLVDQMRASNPAMRVLVAQIIPMNPSSCPECASRVVALNAAIPGWAAGKTTAASPITVVDQWTGFNTATDTGDGVHPNAAGDRKMADRWYPALDRVLGSVPPSSPPPSSASPSPSRSASASPSPSRSSSPPSSQPPSSQPPSSQPPSTGACAATYKIVGQWNDGFQGEVTVRNSGTRPITGWTTGFTFAGGERVSQFWGATLTQTGAAVSATNLSWNGSPAPNATATYGFIGAGTSGTPTVTCTAA